MKTSIKKIFTSYSIALGIASAILGLSVYVGMNIKRIDNLENSVQRVEVKIDIKFKKIDARFDRIESDITGLKTYFAFIKGIIEYQISSKDASTQKKSPLALTELGVKNVKTNNLKEIIETNL